MRIALLAILSAQLLGVVLLLAFALIPFCCIPGKPRVSPNGDLIIPTWQPAPPPMLPVEDDPGEPA